MALFYDPKDTTEQKKIESILKENGIDYELHTEPVTGKGPLQIFVSESNLVRADKLIFHHKR